MTTAAPPAPEAPPRTTPRGTPCAHSWDDAWVAQVEAREQATGRRICGAPEDNRNAVVHGLYSRRLMICGTHCPAWQSCPMGGGATFSLEKEKVAPKETNFGGMGFQPMQHEPIASDSEPGNPNDVDAIRETDAAGRTGWKPVPPKNNAPLSYGQQLMKLPLSERPQCSYELAEYNATVTDVMKRTQAVANNSFGLHIAHQVALLTVMVSRAAGALATKPFTEKMEQSADNYYMSVDRPSAGLVAFEKLSRELRRWIHLVEREYQVFTADPTSRREHDLRQQCDTRHDPDHAAALDLTSSIAHLEAARETAKRTATFREMDKQIVETMFARFGVKPNGQTNSDKLSDTPLSSPRKRRPLDEPNATVEGEVPAFAGMTIGAVSDGMPKSASEGGGASSRAKGG